MAQRWGEQRVGGMPHRKLPQVKCRHHTLRPPVPPPPFLPRSCLGAAPWDSSVLGKVEPKALGWTRCLGTKIQSGCAWPAMGC